MKKKIILAFLLAFALIAVAASVYTNGSYQNEYVKESSEYAGYDIEALQDCRNADTISLEGVKFEPPHSPWLYPLLDDYKGVLYWQNFTNIFNGTYGNIWVGLSDYDEYYDFGPVGFSPEDIWAFGYPWTPTGIEDYLPAGYRDTITGQDLLDVLHEFDTNIHDTDVGYFGQYADRPGPYDDYKVQIMVFNVRDEFFYDPVNAPGFIEGYFWSEIARNFNTNAFHMDTYQWWRRQGENPPMVDPLTGYDYSFLSIKPWEYEGTFAHEFQHLINNDVDPDELSWVDEGMSTLAEWLCGYGFSPGHISQYIIWFWDTPLTIWEGYLADYGASFLWTFYMYEHYGGEDLIWDVCHDPGNGIEGWSNALAARGVYRTFDQIFQDWCIANYLDDTSFGFGRYGYYELDIPSENSEGYSIPYVTALWDASNPGLFNWFVDQYPYYGDYIAAGRGLEYTASYVEFTSAPYLFEIDFDGADTCGAAPTSGTHNWYSDGEAWSWFTLSQDFDIPATGAFLYFSNYFSIESGWDYGYVEVHDYDTDLWTTLPGLGTIDVLGHAQDNPNTTLAREPSTYNESGRWNCFTGDSGGVYTEEMNLTAFAGHKIGLSFTYWTDGYSLGSGWYLDDIEIPEISFSDDCETTGDWIVNHGWYLNDEIIYNDFGVSIIQTHTYYLRDGGIYAQYTNIHPMTLDTDTEEGSINLMSVNAHYYHSSDPRIATTFVMVTANQPGYEHTFGTTYAFTARARYSWYWPYF
jgi:immune inhibitor A